MRHCKFFRLCLGKYLSFSSCLEHTPPKSNVYLHKVRSLKRDSFKYRHHIPSLLSFVFTVMSKQSALVGLWFT